MKLEGKIAVIYGGGGAIGGAVARAFGAEGARLFLAGRHLAPLEAVAGDVVAAGGSAEVAEVDALDERAVDEHLETVVDRAGVVDVSFNAIGIPNPKIRVPLVELEVERFSLPIATYTRSYFLTARLAARRMVANRSGVIMTVTSIPSRTGIPLVGGGGPAMAAVEALTRDLSAELAPRHSRGRPAAAGDAGDTYDQGRLRTSRQGFGHDVGTVAGVPRKQNPRSPAHEPRGAGTHGRIHGFRSGKRDDWNDRQLDHGQRG